MKFKLSIYIISITFILSLFHPISAYSYWVWTPQTKRWVNPKYAPKDTPKEQLIYAMDLFEAGEHRKALEEFKKVVAYYKRSESAAEAQYYIGRCHEELKNPFHAFEAYQKVIDNYPFTQRVDEIVKRQFQIGEDLYKGERVKYVGLKVNPVPEHIIKIYKKVVSNGPYSEYAPLAQYRIGELYKKIGFYAEAREAFQKIITDYPDSELADKAKFQVAICASTGSLDAGYDQKLTAEAIEEFEQFIRQHPESKMAKEAIAERNELLEKKAESLYKTAHFYERLKKYESAIIYYNEIIEDFPDTEAAAKATDRLEIVEEKY